MFLGSLEGGLKTQKMSFMESRSSYDPEKLLAAVRAFEKVIESNEELCRSGESLARLFGIFFAMRAAFAIRCSLALGDSDLPEMAAGSEQQSMPTLNIVHAAKTRLVAAVTSSDRAATMNALEEMGVFALCPNPREQLSRLERMTTGVGSGTRLVLLVELALFAIELRDFDATNRYVAEAHAFSPSSWELYNLCVLEGLLALKAGKLRDALQSLEKSSNACQVAEHVSLNCAVRTPNS